MELFSGLDYLRIDIANHYGLDKKLWSQRLEWFAFNEHRLEELVQGADEPYLMAQAVMAYRDVQKGLPTGYVMYLDCTNSGYQWLAILSGCLDTAKTVNLVNTGKREDAYKLVTDEMNKLLPTTEQVTRKLMKNPVNL